MIRPRSKKKLYLKYVNGTSHITFAQPHNSLHTVIRNINTVIKRNIVEKIGENEALTISFSLVCLLGSYIIKVKFHQKKKRKKEEEEI